MSTYNKVTKNPKTGKWELATWIDDFYSIHHYVVRFSNGEMYDPEKTELETREIEDLKKIEEKIEKAMTNKN